MLEKKIQEIQAEVAQINKAQSQTHEDERPSEDRESNGNKEKTELIMCMDSNSKHLIRRKLWDLDGTEFKKCYTLSQVKNVVTQTLNYRNSSTS